MSKQKKIEKAKEQFLNCTGTFLEKSKLAKIYLETVRENGTPQGIFRSRKWKENRDKKLKDSCETCGSTDGLHISHIWHPPKGQEMKNHVYQVHGAQIDYMHHVFVEKDACPACYSTGAIKFLKTLGKFKCYSRKGYSKFQSTLQKIMRKKAGLKTSCGAIFDYPSKKKVKVKSKEITFHDAYSYYYALEHISLSERYFEMRDGDILTECKKCGFERDKRKIEEKKFLDSIIFSKEDTLAFLRDKYKNKKA